MGLLEKLFPGRTAAAQAVTYFEALNYKPVFHNWRGAIYEQELVRSAIDALARHSSKLQFTVKGSAKPALQNKLNHGPNEYQTWSQFLYQARTILEVDTTLFIVPVYDRYGDMTGIYPINPRSASIEEYNGKQEKFKGKLFVKYVFAKNQTASVELENCAILTRFQYDHEFFGGGNEALKDTLDLLHLQKQGIEEGIKNSASFRFMAKHKRFIDQDDLAKEQNRFTEKHLSGKGGMLLFPNEFDDIKQIDSKPFVVDAKQQELINTNVSNYFGVNTDILQNKAMGDAWSAFYEGAIETFAIQLSETLTKMCFTFREQSNGCKVMFTSNRMQYMSNKDKLEVSSQMVDRGIISINDAREIWNLPPVEDGDRRVIRGEYYDATQKLEGDNNGTE